MLNNPSHILFANSYAYSIIKNPQPIFIKYPFVDDLTYFSIFRIKIKQVNDCCCLESKKMTIKNNAGTAD